MKIRCGLCGATTEADATTVEDSSCGECGCRHVRIWWWYPRFAWVDHHRSPPGGGARCRRWHEATWRAGRRLLRLHPLEPREAIYEASHARAARTLGYRYEVTGDGSVRVAHPF